MKKLILGLTLCALSGLSPVAFSDDDDDDKKGGKATICHKGKTASINVSGVSGHLCSSL